MSRADRIVQRREWRGACPPVFDRAQKQRVAEARGLKLEELRTSWQVWCTAWTVHR